MPVITLRPQAMLRGLDAFGELSRSLLADWVFYVALGGTCLALVAVAPVGLVWWWLRSLARRGA